MSRPVAVFNPADPAGINQLLTTNQAWVQNETATISPNLFTTIAPKQVPKILWLGCSDSRVPETSLLGLNPGEVFTQRNIANLFNPQDVSFPAVLTYAVEHVGTTHVILCGHASCGGAQAALAANYAPCGIAPVDAWLDPLRALIKRHVNLIKSAGDINAQIKALVTLNVQHGVKLLKANNTIAETAGVVVHGAVYDLASGLLSFLDATPEPQPDFMVNPGEIIRVGNFDTSQVRSIPQTNTSMTYTFAQPYSKPPRIVLGLTSFDVTTHHDNPRMMCLASNITTTGFQISIDTWGSSQINDASCTWLEIPDTPDYVDFQTGLFKTYDDHTWDNWRPLTTRQINFTTPFSAPPTVVVWITGFDTGQNLAMGLYVYASQVTTTGFLMNLDTTSGQPVFGQWTNWVAIPPVSPFGIQVSDFGSIGNTSQTTTGTSTFDQRDLNATLAPVVVGAMNQVLVSSPTSFRAKVALSNVTGSTVDWNTSTWGDGTMSACKGTYLTLPGMNVASSVL